MFGRVTLRRMDEWVRMDAVRRPRPEYLSVRSLRTLDPLVAVRKYAVETVAESDKVGFQLIGEEHRPPCLFASQAWSENGW